MESMNKFKVLTIIVLCMFVFVIAAIYTNTKDATNSKLQNRDNAQNQQVSESLKYQDQYAKDNITDIKNQITVINARVDELSERVDKAKQKGTGLNCRIYGSLTSKGVERLSSEEAIEEAKVNNNEIVITCSL